MIAAANKFILVLLSVNKITFAYYIESCTNQNFENKHGSCVPIQECPPLYKILQTRPLNRESVEILKKSNCGFSGHTPKVCCFNEIYDITTLSTDSSVTKNVENCGLYSEDRIIGGSIAPLDQYPWDVLLVYKTENGSKFNCAGVLIGEKYVLTAAHCITDKLASVRFGEQNIETNPDCDDFGPTFKTCLPHFFEIPIAEKISHEDYKNSENQLENDIALLKLQSPAIFSDFISPACLPSGPPRDLSGARLPAVTAWGIHDGRMKYTVKRRATVQVANSSVCDFGTVQLKLSPKQICVDKNRENFCADDSGGAIFDINRETYNHYVAGILSFGSCNVDSSKPRVYTRVDQYKDWIVNKLKL